MDRYLKETQMLNFSAKNIQMLISKRKWKALDTFERIKAIYNYVRDEILFGYNVDDSIPAFISIFVVESIKCHPL